MLRAKHCNVYTALAPVDENDKLARLQGALDSVSGMDAEQLQKKLELSADEDFILTAWQYRMTQRQIAASTGKHLRPKRDAGNSSRVVAVAALAQRNHNDWSPAVAELVRRVAPPRLRILAGTRS